MSDLRILIDYIPAKLHEGKRWYVDYYVKTPVSNELKRKQIKLNRIKNLAERRRFAKRLVQKINIKLANGWNPLIEKDAGKSFFTLKQVSEIYLKDKRTLRPATKKTYVELQNRLLDWVKKVYKEDLYIINIDREFAIKYCDELWSQGISETSYNSYLRNCSSFFNWCIEHNYVKVNPFLTIKRKKEREKRREMNIPEADRIKIRDYWLKKNPRYLGIIYMAYHCLLRPKEISFIKRKHIDLEKQTITVEGFFAKNHKTRKATIPNVMMELITELVKDVKKDQYVFGSGYVGSNKKGNEGTIGRTWITMRKKLGISDKIQFYSLRDTGIIQKLKDGLDVYDVMNLADHSSIEITNGYIKKSREEGNLKAMETISEF